MVFVGRKKIIWNYTNKEIVKKLNEQSQKKYFNNIDVMIGYMRDHTKMDLEKLKMIITNEEQNLFIRLIALKLYKETKKK